MYHAVGFLALTIKYEIETLPGYWSAIFSILNSYLLLGNDALQGCGCGALLHDGSHDDAAPQGDVVILSSAVGYIFFFF